MSFLKQQRHNYIMLFIMVLILIIMCLFAITQGSVKIPVRDVFDIFENKLMRSAQTLDVKESYLFIVWNVRLPRILLAIFVGGLLSVVGVAFQAIFKNPMADPYVMGVSSGAAFGATIGIVFGIGFSVLGLGVISMMAFVGALVTVFIVYSLASYGNKVSTTSILLAGIVMNALLSSIISLMMILNQDDISKIVTWTMGSFNGASWESIYLMILPTLIGFAYILFHARDLNAIVLGEEDAKNIGVNVEFLKRSLLIVSSFLAAFSVAVSGIIGFVGLMIPHLFRLIFGSNHKMLIPVSFVGGALFMLICDTLARGLVPNMEIPVGVITSIFGGPFFLYLLYKNKRKLI